MRLLTLLAFLLAGCLLAFPAYAANTDGSDDWTCTVTLTCQADT